MKLEQLVPPLELCKKIPEGAFDDSALVWLLEVAANRHHGEWWEVVYRESAYEDEEFYPAPTLAEIMIAIEDLGYSFPTCYRQANTWQVDCEEDGEERNPFPKLYDSEDRTNPAAAALKLWLELPGMTGRS